VPRVRETIGPLHVFFQCLSKSRHPHSFCRTSFTLHWANRLLTVTGGVALNWLDQISQESVCVCVCVCVCVFFFPLRDITDTSGAEGKLALAHICLPGSCNSLWWIPRTSWTLQQVRLTSYCTSPWPDKVLIKKLGKLKWSNIQLSRD